MYIFRGKGSFALSTRHTLSKIGTEINAARASEESSNAAFEGASRIILYPRDIVVHSARSVFLRALATVKIHRRLFLPRL